MSFILDALKKSENERQLNAPPEFATVPADPDAPGAPRWLWVLGGLLLINLFVVVALLTRDAPVPVTPAPADTAPVRDTETAAPAVTTSPARGGDAFADRLEEARRNRPERVAQGATVASAAPDRNEPAVRDASDAASRALLPSLDELRLSGDVDLPEMHLDIHVWSENASERFVFINMDKYRERDTMSAGPAVAEITPDGVVLEYRGRRFMLPRD